MHVITVLIYLRLVIVKSQYKYDIVFITQN